ncbi:MAG: hypothetical protein ABF295_01410 [Flavobacteriaceae bacterium]
MIKNLVSIITFTVLILGVSTASYGQENYGNVLNAFVKFGDNSSISANYEFQVANNVTVSPEARIWFSGENDFALGGRADYYFDSLLNLVEPWDIWAGADAGFVIGDGDDFSINLHIGGEYKFNETWGIILEFGGGTTTAGGIGVGIHF